MFLIKLTSLPILVLIGIYEGFFAEGSRLRKSSVGAAQSFFHSLPRHIKHMPLVEALVGSTTNELYDAIFDMDLASEYDPFGDEGEEDRGIHAIRSVHSRETLNLNMRSRRATPSPTPRSKRQKSPVTSSGLSLRTRNTSGLQPLELTSVHRSVEPSLSSPLARLYAPRTPGAEERAAMSIEGAARRVEGLLEDMQELPVQKLRDEMMELQVCCQVL